MTCRLSNVVIILAGLGAIVWGVIVATYPNPTCRGITMGAGDVCHYASPTDAKTDRVQTYEQRVSAARQSAPVLMGLGVTAVIYGALVIRQTRCSVQASASDIGP